MTLRHVPGLTWEDLLTTACLFTEASTVLIGEIAAQLSVQIFGSVASSRSRLHGAMRKSRQPRCTAAILTIAAAKPPKRLVRYRNSS
jgi:hypothetical protein